MIRNLLFDIYYSIAHQKLRTILTGFGVAWGIFILVLLLGASGGLEKGILQLLSGFAQNSIWLYGGNSTAEKGNNKFTKPVIFSSLTINQLKENYPEQIEFISPEARIASKIIYKEKNLNAQLLCVMPDYFNIKILKPKYGRLLNQGDNIRKSKVAVIGKQVKDQAFGDKHAIGNELQIGNTFFKIVGVLKGGSIFSQSEQNMVFVPYQTSTVCLNMKDEFKVIGLTLNKTCNTEIAETHIKKYFGRLLGIDSDDTNALYVFNFNQQVKSFHKIFNGLNIFFWFIGICLLLSGMVGVSNIMFVIVHERTREIGIRKAVGAKRKHILWMILFESASVTLIAGIAGIVLGAGTLSVIGYAIKKLADKDFLIKDISINWATIAGALFVLIISGIIAGLIPAKRATEIEPIEAIRMDT